MNSAHHSNRLIHIVTTLALILVMAGSGPLFSARQACAHGDLEDHSTHDCPLCRTADGNPFLPVATIHLLQPAALQVLVSGTTVAVRSAPSRTSLGRAPPVQVSIP